MSDVYENCPAFENDKFLLRFSQLDDAEDLVIKMHYRFSTAIIVMEIISIIQMKIE
jgi:hypothetical protein